ncbi:MAG: hypothetical protein Q4G49_16440 [Paracoccus sp. (in: a-proteobacteria)]|nr:hypothetical protein [Paracoccus sp. (in: a-proteobacteria)]
MRQTQPKPITEYDINLLLSLISKQPDERIKAESYLLENLLPYEQPDPSWAQAKLPKEKAVIARAAERRGFVRKEMEPWLPESPNGDGLDGYTHYYELTGSGQQRLMEWEQGWFKRSALQIRDNTPTIVVSVLTSVLTAAIISWWRLNT